MFYLAILAENVFLLPFDSLQKLYIFSLYKKKITQIKVEIPN